MDDASINFIELVALTRITPESTVERFGSLINSSFFDASNILATMKLKGLVDFVTAFPNQSALTVAEGGKRLLDEANMKATEPIDALDLAIMVQLANGRRGLADLNTSINVTQRDLSVHLFKLSTQQMISYEMANANLNVYLTEKGFITVKSSVPQTPMSPATPPQSMPPQTPTAQVQQAQQMAGMTVPQPSATLGGAASNAGQGGDTKVIEELIKRSRARKKQRLIMMMVIGVVVVLLIVLVLLNKI